MVDVVQPLVCRNPPQPARRGVLRSKRAKQSRLHKVHMVRCAVLAQMRHVVACALAHCVQHASLAPSARVACLAASQERQVVLQSSVAHLHRLWGSCV